MSLGLRVAGQVENLRAPARLGDAGLDLVSTSRTLIHPGGLALVGTGVRVQIPFGYAGLILPRSSACKTGVTVTNAPGLIDSGYRGEIKVGLCNVGDESKAIQVGDRIAQLVIVAIPSVDLIHVDSLDESDRGDNGFGSTGR